MYYTWSRWAFHIFFNHRQESSGFVNAGWLVYAATDSGQVHRPKKTGPAFFPNSPRGAEIAMIDIEKTLRNGDFLA